MQSMENENSGNCKMENIFYAALALHVAGKPLNKENIRVVLRAAGTPVDEQALDMVAAFIESLKVSHGKNGSYSDPAIARVLTNMLSQHHGPTQQWETLLREFSTRELPVNNTPKGRYVYGIAVGGKEARLGPIGLEGSEVYILSYQDLGAIVHNCPTEPYQSPDDEKVKTWVKEHQSVLDAAKKQYDIIIPLGFDTIIKAGDDNISPDQVVKDWLKEDYERFHFLISRIKGKDEYAVQVSYLPSAVGKYMTEPSEEVKTIREQLTKKSPGIAYIYKQKLEKAVKADMERLADMWFKNFFNCISQHVDRVIVEKTRKLDSDKVMLLNLSCLVDKEKVESLGEELEKINSMEGFSVHFSGPWPPYSFVAGPVGAKEGTNGSH
jgi:hypothetical protein